MRVDALFRLCAAAQTSSEKYSVPVIVTVPSEHISLIKRSFPRLLVFAQHLDGSRPGTSVGVPVAETVKEAGADGVMLNHSARPLDEPTLLATMERARETGLLTMVCTGEFGQAKRIAAAHPDVLLYEPVELIGSAGAGPRPWIQTVNETVTAIDPGILLMHAGGIGSTSDANLVITAGADGTGATSAIVLADLPELIVDGFIAAVRGAWDARSVSAGR